jgi:CheY-like chemotaxis protein
LVEDDAADISLILNVLRRHPNVATACAVDAPLVALSQLATGQLRPDLLLLDIQMPRINGFVFLERLRQIPTMAKVPVAFLSTSGMGSDVVIAKHSSASYYLIKPDSYIELQARLNELIKQAIAGNRRN